MRHLIENNFPAGQKGFSIEQRKGTIVSDSIIDGEKNAGQISWAIKVDPYLRIIHLIAGISRYQSKPLFIHRPSLLLILNLGK